MRALRDCGIVCVTAVIAVLAASTRAELWAQGGENAAPRTDSFETKVRLLEEAWKRGDYDLARSLTHSLRDTIIQAQHEQQSPSASRIETAKFRTTDSLPFAWRQWARPWAYFKVLSLEEPIGEARTSEPVEPELEHTGSPQMFYRWHGHVWSRYPLPAPATVPKGAVLRQKNAYVSLPFTEEEGKEQIEKLHRCLIHPLGVSASDNLELPDDPSPASAPPDSVPPARLARPGEAGDSPIPKRLIWEALQDCKDAQLYTADVSVVDLGLVHDVRVRGDVITVVMTMPHRGRPRIGYFIDGSTSVHPTPSLPVRERLMKLPGVRQVVVELTWEAPWSSNRLTEVGRQKLGLE